MIIVNETSLNKACDPGVFYTALRDGIPIYLGVLPFGLTYGMVALAAGLNSWEAVAMSLFVFVGSAPIPPWNAG